MELNEASSKSLLANVLDINDDFGVINKQKNLKLNKLPNEFISSYDSGDHNFMKRDNSSLSSESITSKPEMNSLKLNLNSILSELKFITKKVHDDEIDENKSLHWKFAAMVIDRLCMVFFTVATFVSTAVILFSSKNFFKFK
jgi:nicotinic acetylcholine receptor